MQTLLLNSDYTPLKVLDWRKAMNLVFRGVVEIVEEYDDSEIKSISMSLRCPSVLKLKRFINIFGQKVKFSKYGVFSRDHFTCLYCGCQPGVKNLTIDHVVPRCKGGKTDWTNVVAACSKCNSRKGDKIPYDARMVLKREPFKPDMSSYIKLTINLPKTPEGWANYLNYNTLLE